MGPTTLHQGNWEGSCLPVLPNTDKQTGKGCRSKGVSEPAPLLLVPVGGKPGEYQPIQILTSKGIVEVHPAWGRGYSRTSLQCEALKLYQSSTSPMQGNAYIRPSCQVLVTSPVEEAEHGDC